MATKPRKKPVRPRVPGQKYQPLKFVVTPDILKEVEILSGRGLTQEHIFDYYSISRSCWFNNIQHHPELGEAVRRGKAKTISKVSGKLMEQVLKGNLSAIIFYLKTQARWSENAASGDEGGEKPPSPALTITVHDPVEASKIYQQIMIGS
jgi:hypothetical protein